MFGNLLSAQSSGNRWPQNVCHENEGLEEAFEHFCVQRSNILSVACKLIKRVD
jgi:hypothetical protein